MSPVRTQGAVGTSLGPLYDTEGTRLSAGADILDGEIHLVHELGGQVAAERMRWQLRTGTATAIAQSTAFEARIVDLPDMCKITGWWIEVGTAGRLRDAGIYLENSTEAQGVPLMLWDSATGTTGTFQMFGGDRILLIPGAAMGAAYPNRDFAYRNLDASNNEVELVLRGQTSAFGAGDVTIAGRIAMLFFSRSGGLGLLPPGAIAPYPSW